MDGGHPNSGGEGPVNKRPRTEGLGGQDDLLALTDARDESQQVDTGADAAVDAASEAEAATGPQLTEDLDSMTETVRAGMFMMQTRAQAADAKVSHLCISQAPHLQTSECL